MRKYCLRDVKQQKIKRHQVKVKNFQLLKRKGRISVLYAVSFIFRLVCFVKPSKSTIGLT